MWKASTLTTVLFLFLLHLALLRTFFWAPYNPGNDNMEYGKSIPGWSCAMHTHYPLYSLSSSDPVSYLTTLVSSQLDHEQYNSNRAHFFYYLQISVRMKMEAYGGGRECDL